MAKLGEGDKRWIVEDRPDGTNVHNWHWAETDCLSWAHTFLTNLLCNQTLLSGQANLHIKTKPKLDKLDGEAYVNIRKGKIIPGYELHLVLSYEAVAKDSDGKTVILSTEGTVEFPYIADENAGEDPEIRFTIRDDGPIGKRMKEAVIEKGKPFFFDKVREFVDVMAKGGPARDELQVKKPVKKAVVETVEKAKEKGSISSNDNEKKKKNGKEGFKTITMSEKFSCRARDLYEILMDENRWKGFSQSNARISKEVGGEFSIFDGSVSGRNVELIEGKLIVQSWRFGNWADGVMSTVRLEFEEPESGVTVVKLTHTDVPEEDRYGNSTVVENTERGWRDLIFHRIRAVFGFGM